MSKITTVIDKVIEKLGELFPSPANTRIPNAYALEKNNDNLLEVGYGLRVGAATYVPFEFCSFVVDRTFTVVFTREMHRLESETDPTDEIVKQLLESVVSVQKLFYSYNELGIDADILKVDIGGVSAVETFLGERQNFLSMTADFNFQIKEEL